MYGTILVDRADRSEGGVRYRMPTSFLDGPFWDGPFYVFVSVFPLDKFHFVFVSDSMVDGDSCRFPMSSYLNEIRLSMCRGARMLASQSPDRILREGMSSLTFLIWQSFWEEFFLAIFKLAEFGIDGLQICPDCTAGAHGISRRRHQ